MGRVVVNFWAGARAAAGRASEEVDAATPAGVLAELRSRHPDEAFAGVLAACSLLVDGVALHADQHDRPFAGGPEATVRFEVLPPFAGGSGPPPSCLKV